MRFPNFQCSCQILCPKNCSMYFREGRPRLMQSCTSSLLPWIFAKSFSHLRCNLKDSGQGIQGIFSVFPSLLFTLMVMFIRFEFWHRIKSSLTYLWKLLFWPGDLKKGINIKILCWQTYFRAFKKSLRGHSTWWLKSQKEGLCFTSACWGSVLGSWLWLKLLDNIDTWKC